MRRASRPDHLVAVESDCRAQRRQRLQRPGWCSPSNKRAKVGRPDLPPAPCRPELPAAGSQRDRHQRWRPCSHQV